jgi:hypothetical protein
VPAATKTATTVAMVFFYGSKYRNFDAYILINHINGVLHWKAKIPLLMHFFVAERRQQKFLGMVAGLSSVVEYGEDGIAEASSVPIHGIRGDHYFQKNLFSGLLMKYQCSIVEVDETFVSQ